MAIIDVKNSATRDVVICFMDRVGAARELETVVSAQGWRVHAVSSFDGADAQLLMRGCAKNGAVFVFVDYPIGSPEDAQAVVLFAKQAAAQPGWHYYAPRPNRQLLVERPSLVALNPVPAIMLQAAQSSIVPSLSLRFLKIIWRYTPCSIQARTKGIATVVYRVLSNKLRRSKLPEPNPVEVGSKRPLAENPEIGNGDLLPQSLQKWGGVWRHTVPTEETLRHDLLDRMDMFFPAPKGIHVVLLNQCNLECVMCPYHSPKYKAGHTSDYFDKRRAMTDVVMDQVIEYAAEHNIVLQFGQIEEPFMHKKLLDYLEKSARAGVPNIHMTTNGTLMTPDKARRLAKSGITSVMFSIDASEADSYREIRGGELADLEEKIRYFVPLAKKEGIRVTVSFILNPTTKSEQDAFLAKWRDFGIDQVTYYVLTDHEVSTGESIRRDDFYDHGERYPCASPWVQSVIYPDGEVSICCKSMTDIGWRGLISLGNLKQQSYDDIWRGESYKNLRVELLNNSFKTYDVCTKCQIWSSTTSFTEETDAYVLTYNETVKTYSFKGKK